MFVPYEWNGSAASGGRRAYGLHHQDHREYPNDSTGRPAKITDKLIPIPTQYRFLINADPGGDVRAKNRMLQ